MVKNTSVIGVKRKLGRVREKTSVEGGTLTVAGQTFLGRNKQVKAKDGAQRTLLSSEKTIPGKPLVKNIADDSDDVKEMIELIEGEAKKLRSELDASNSRVSHIIYEIEQRH